MNLKRILTGLVAAATTIVLASCGSSSTATSWDSCDFSGNCQGFALTIKASFDDGQGHTQVVEARCGDKASACSAKALESLREAMKPIAADAVCTALYGGPQRIDVKATLNKDSKTFENSRLFVRNNGCEIAAYQTFVKVLQDNFDVTVPATV